VAPGLLELEDELTSEFKFVGTTDGRTKENAVADAARNVTAYPTPYGSGWHPVTVSHGRPWQVVNGYGPTKQPVTNDTRVIVPKFEPRTGIVSPSVKVEPAGEFAIDVIVGLGTTGVASNAVVTGAFTTGGA
jgi:hypothetical protein